MAGCMLGRGQVHNNNWSVEACGVHLKNWEGGCLGSRRTGAQQVQVEAADTRDFRAAKLCCNPYQRC